MGYEEQGERNGVGRTRRKEWGRRNEEKGWRNEEKGMGQRKRRIGTRGRELGGKVGYPRKGNLFHSHRSIPSHGRGKNP
jgi:hypothetical protein